MQRKMSLETVLGNTGEEYILVKVTGLALVHVATPPFLPRMAWSCVRRRSIYKGYEDIGRSDFICRQTLQTIKERVRDEVSTSPTIIYNFAYKKHDYEQDFFIISLRSKKVTFFSKVLQIEFSKRLSSKISSYIVQVVSWQIAKNGKNSFFAKKIVFIKFFEKITCHCLLRTTFYNHNKFYNFTNNRF